MTYSCSPVPDVGDDYYRLEVEFDRVMLVDRADLGRHVPCLGVVTVRRLTTFADTVRELRALEALAMDVH